MPPCNIHTALQGSMSFSSSQFKVGILAKHPGGSGDIICKMLTSPYPPKKVAIKCFRSKRDIDQQENQRAIQNELNVWKLLSNHDNILPLLGLVEEYAGLSSMSYMAPWPVCEYYDNRGLNDFLRESNVDDSKRLHMLMDVARGLSHIHSLSIVHGDLKASNVVVGNKGNIAKICDFGSSCIACDCYDGPQGQTGTVQWDSPEVREDIPRSSSSDIWAFGCLALE
ncbi:hypothetical protein FS749_000116, partial [Ceratobasidium sp. UAMH 11750]